LITGIQGATKSGLFRAVHAHALSRYVVHGVDYFVRSVVITENVSSREYRMADP
jgi:hypothetical protein